MLPISVWKRDRCVCNFISAISIIAIFIRKTMLNVDQCWECVLQYMAIHNKTDGQMFFLHPTGSFIEVPTRITFKTVPGCFFAFHKIQQTCRSNVYNCTCSQSGGISVRKWREVFREPCLRGRKRWSGNKKTCRVNAGPTSYDVGTALTRHVWWAM